MNARKFRNWLKLNDPYITPGDSKEIQHVLNGDVAATSYAILWADSPQGWSFWREVRQGARMSKRTRQFLAKLRDEAKRRGC